ncbi:MmcQ/YjbR family DNA-binding protein [Myxococcus sp. Y35]|uniref:MmcQ/YjbR family DNA-binding protein n=1 Tax=Pseudomyxococcus flavus TaxID=3115648 RepID=UPI003CEA9470
MATRGKVRAGRGGTGAALTFDAVRELALSLPGMEEGTSFGTPAFRVRKKLIARFHEDGESLVVKLEPGMREVLMQAEPESCFITDHYAGYPEYMLVRVARARPPLVRQLLEDAWRRSASKRQLAEREQGGG